RVLPDVGRPRWSSRDFGQDGGAGDGAARACAARRRGRSPRPARDELPRAAGRHSRPSGRGRGGVAAHVHAGGPRGGARARRPIGDDLRRARGRRPGPAARDGGHRPRAAPDHRDGRGGRQGAGHARARGAPGAPPRQVGAGDGLRAERDAVGDRPDGARPEDSLLHLARGADGLRHRRLPRLRDSGALAAVPLRLQQRTGFRRRRRAGRSREAPRRAGGLPGMTQVNLAIETGGIAFRNPVLTASGTFGYGKEFEGLTDLRSLGGLVTKGISPQPRFGNATPRICETASGMLNSIGLENVGVEGFERDKLPYLRQCGTRVLVNFFGATFDEYVDCGGRLDRMDGVDGLEMNVSCPNIKAGGIEFGTDPKVLRDLVRACREVIKKPLWIKLTPNTSDIVALAKACADGGADGLSIINTITGMAIDARTRKPKIATIFAGLSGPAIKPIALRMVFQVRRAGVPLPISGIGGIQDATDAIEFFLAGASTVQVGTQSFVDPDASGHIVRELAERLAADGVTDVREIVGALKTD